MFEHLVKLALEGLDLEHNASTHGVTLPLILNPPERVKKTGLDKNLYGIVIVSLMSVSLSRGANSIFWYRMQ